jgi:hypothetical protein
MKAIFPGHRSSHWRLRKQDAAGIAARRGQAQSQWR